MAQSIYQQRLAERDIPRLQWETQVAEGASISDLDADEVLRTARLGVEAGRVPEDTTQASAEEVLRKFHLTQGGALLNAAVALFGQPDPIRYPQMRLHLAHFNGTTKDADMLDLVPPMEGHAFALLREAEDFRRKRR
jgi:ATP-dependent DNA helicase RecG